VVALILAVWRRIDPHFEVIFLAYAWLNASVLAVLVGRPWLGAIGIVTVAPFLALYVSRHRAK
jgi:hypothetical protein